MMSKSLSLSFMPMLLQHLLKLRSQPWWLSLIVWIVLVGPAQAAVQLRVAINQGTNVQVGSSTDAIVRNSAGEKVGEIAAMNSFNAVPNRGNVSLATWQSQQLWIEPSNDGYVWIDNRWYRGKTQLVPTGNSVTAINHVDLEQYLSSVVGAEMIASWPQIGRAHV